MLKLLFIRIKIFLALMKIRIINKHVCNNYIFKATQINASKGFYFGRSASKRNDNGRKFAKISHICPFIMINLIK